MQKPYMSLRLVRGLEEELVNSCIALALNGRLVPPEDCHKGIQMFFESADAPVSDLFRTRCLPKSSVHQLGNRWPPALQRRIINTTSHP